MMPFDTVFPDIAKNEVRVFHVHDHDELPRGAYLFREFYCNEPACDCRRVRILQDKGNGRNFSRLATGAKDKGAIAG